MGSIGGIIEGDSKGVIQWLRGGICPWKYLDQVEETREIIHRFNPKVIQIPREANTRADQLAEEGGHLHEIRTIISLT